MKLHEAIEKCLASGCKLTMRRESWPLEDFAEIAPASNLLYLVKNNNIVRLDSVDDLLADDWIVE